jgi:hypothetical protein
MTVTAARGDGAGRRARSAAAAGAQACLLPGLIHSELTIGCRFAQQLRKL